METTSLDAATAAAHRLRNADAARRQAEADTITALCELAETYHLDEGELLQVLVDNDLQIAGTDTPMVSQYLCLEVAGLLRCSPRAAGSRIADALNLKCRHPRLYEATMNLHIDTARALKAASRCHDLHPLAADAATTLWLARQHKLGWTAAFNLLDKLIIQADPQLAAKKETAARQQRGVWVWGLHDGAMNLTGKLDVLDARFVDARLDEIAGLIEDSFPALTHAQRRAKAVGILANPAYATALLQQAAQQALPLGPEDAPGPVPADTREQEDPDDALIEVLDDASHYDPHRCPGHHCGTITVPPSKLRPRLGIAVHIHADAIGASDCTARIEQAGHITTSLLAELLNSDGIDVTVQPVIDLPTLEPENQYTPSTRMRRAVTLAFPTEAFPYSNTNSHGLDLDHTTAYHPDQNGQTRIGNLAPLGRRAHRAKTAGYWTLDQTEPGLLEWQSPLGYRYRVTTSGTTPRAG